MQTITDTQIAAGERLFETLDFERLFLVVRLLLSEEQVGYYLPDPVGSKLLLPASLPETGRVEWREGSRTRPLVATLLLGRQGFYVRVLAAAAGGLALQLPADPAAEPWIYWYDDRRWAKEGGGDGPR